MTPDRARELLETEAERIRRLQEEERARLSVSLEDSTSELTSFDQHQADVATETHDRSVDESLAESFTAGLADIDDARQRLDDGTYGKCAVCGVAIPDERLEARPAAKYCVEHQQERDQAAASQRS